MFRHALILGLLGVLAAPPAAAQWTSRLSVSAQGGQFTKESGGSDITPDGRFVVLLSRDPLATGGPGSKLQVVLLDRSTHDFELISATPQGAPSNDDAVRGFCSADGRYVVFGSLATDLVPGVPGSVQHLYRRDRLTGTTELLANHPDGSPSTTVLTLDSISDDGHRIVFSSHDNELVPGDSDFLDVFLQDMLAGTITRLAHGLQGAEPDNVSYRGSISADGTRVAFSSWAKNLVDETIGTPFHSDVYSIDLAGGAITLLSKSSAGAQGDGNSTHPKISADGSVVAFESDATNLVLGDTNEVADVYVRELATGTTQRISLTLDGEQPNADMTPVAVSADGRFVLFDGEADTLVPGDDNNSSDAFLVDRASGAMTLVTETLDGHVGSWGAVSRGMTGDGTAVLFTSLSTGFVPIDSNLVSDAFLRILSGCDAPVVTYCTPSLTSIPGCQAWMSHQGVPSVAAPRGFLLKAGPIPGGASIGVAYATVNGPAAFPIGTLGGTICAAAFQRVGPALSGGTPGQCDGELGFDLSDLVSSMPGQIQVGITVHFGVWFRDLANPDTFALSNAIWFQICP